MRLRVDSPVSCIYIIAMSDPNPQSIDIAMNCLAVRARMVSRAISTLYQRELKPWAPLTASQVNIMAAIGMLGAPTPKDLVWALQLEKSTLSRNLTRLESRDWVERLAGDKGRQSQVRLSDEGLALIAEIKPAWERAQDTARELLGAAQANELTAMGNGLVGAMR